jgi:hypothetical protein
VKLEAETQGRRMLAHKHYLFVVSGVLGATGGKIMLVM